MHVLSARRDGLLLVVLMATIAGLTAAFWDYTQDDVFITFVYSRNLAEGQGLVFNPGERVQGTTTPLYALIMAGVYALTPDLLHAGNLLGGVVLLGVCGGAIALLRPFSAWPAQAVAALTIAVSPLVYVSLGMETLLYCAILVLALWLWAAGRRALALLAAAALTWTRADGVVLAAAFGAAMLWEVLRAAERGRALRQALVLALIYAGGILPWFGFAWAYFGTPLPQTFSAKEALLQGTLFLQDARTWWRAFYGDNWLLLPAIPLALAGLGRALSLARLRPLALWTVFYAAGYTALNVTAFWYYTPLLVALVLLAVLGAGALPGGRSWPGWGRAALAVLVLVTLVQAVITAWDYRQAPPRMATYRLVGEWIAQHTPADSTLMVKDLGVVGYYARRPTKDTFGLVVPDLHTLDDPYTVLKYRLDTLVTTQYWEMQRLVAQDWFAETYRPLAQISTPGDAEFSPMTIFGRRLALVPPAQALEGDALPLTCAVDLARGDVPPAETRARLIAADGDVLSEAMQPFLWGQFPDQQAAQAETLIEQIALPLDVPPGTYRWELICDRTSTGTVEVLPLAQSERYMSLAGAEWEGFAALRGVLAPAEALTWSGGELAIALDWEAIGPAAQDYSLFVHLVDAQGTVWAQADGFPRGRGVTGWTPGERVIDTRRIALPPDLPPGRYGIVIGWYDWQQEPYPRVALAGGGDALTLPLTVENRWPGGSGRP